MAAEKEVWRERLREFGEALLKAKFRGDRLTFLYNKNEFSLTGFKTPDDAECTGHLFRKGLFGDVFETHDVIRPAAVEDQFRLVEQVLEDAVVDGYNSLVIEIAGHTTTITGAFASPEDAREARGTLLELIQQGQEVIFGSE